GMGERGVAEEIEPLDRRGQLGMNERDRGDAPPDQLSKLRKDRLQFQGAREGHEDMFLHGTLLSSLGKGSTACGTAPYVRRGRMKNYIRDAKPESRIPKGAAPSCPPRGDDRGDLSDFRGSRTRDRRSASPTPRGTRGGPSRPPTSRCGRRSRSSPRPRRASPGARGRRAGR